jgi:malonyl CoA-acyl carrier protein transacylase
MPSFKVQANHKRHKRTFTLVCAVIRLNAEIHTSQITVTTINNEAIFIQPNWFKETVLLNVIHKVVKFFLSHHRKDGSNGMELHLLLLVILHYSVKLVHILLP